MDNNLERCSGCGAAWCGTLSGVGGWEELADCLAAQRDQWQMAAFCAEQARERAEAIVERLSDNDLADRVATNCHDGAHDERWCAACEARGDGIDEYREAVFNAEQAKGTRT